MIPVFTYHKVSAGDAGGGPEFYTVSRGQLARQLDALKFAGRRCVGAEALLEGREVTGENFILSFDDATQDHYDIVFPLLQKRGLHAVFFVPTAKLNQPRRLTDAQVRELACAGQTIGLHSHEHERLDVLDDDELREQFRMSRDIISNLIGGQPWIFAPPGGFLNEHVREVALGFGARAIRTMRWGYNQTLDLTALETIPINRYTDDRKFSRILTSRETPFMYSGKEAVKALIPARAYERLRSLLFDMSGKN
jgi:peptidoglycan/xylan/chitin deacetylase (PgdA/CDA1 family)